MDILTQIQNKSFTDSGLILASTYLQEFGQPESVSEAIWKKELSDASGRLAYHDPASELIQKSVSRDIDLSEGIMEFNCVLMTKSQDRDGDIVEPDGLVIDESMPLLWHHQMNQPVGAMKQLRSRDSNQILIKSVVANTPLGRDTAALIDVGALRISQGFKPKEAVPLSKKMIRGKGEVVTSWHVKKGLTIEHSVVSIPSNTGAIITAYSRKNLESDMVKSWARKHYENRPVIARGYDLPQDTYEYTQRFGEHEITVKSTDKDFVIKEMNGSKDMDDSSKKLEVEDEKLNTDRVQGVNPGVDAEEHFGHKGQGKMKHSDKSESSDDVKEIGTEAKSDQNDDANEKDAESKADEDQHDGGKVEDDESNDDHDHGDDDDDDMGKKKDKSYGGKSCSEPDASEESGMSEKTPEEPGDKKKKKKKGDSESEDDSEDHKFNKSFLGQVEKKMMGMKTPFFPGSFESRSHDLRKMACKQLSCRDYQLYTVATFDDKVILCKSDYSPDGDGPTCYEFEYSVKNGSLKLGDYSEVSIEPSVVKKFMSDAIGSQDPRTLAEVGLTMIATSDVEFMTKELEAMFKATSEMLEISNVQGEEELIKKALTSN